jgi:hypothetical protein
MTDRCIKKFSGSNFKLPVMQAVEQVLGKISDVVFCGMAQESSAF